MKINEATLKHFQVLQEHLIQLNIETSQSLYMC